MEIRAGIPCKTGRTSLTQRIRKILKLDKIEFVRTFSYWIAWGVRMIPEWNVLVVSSSPNRCKWLKLLKGYSFSYTLINWIMYKIKVAIAGRFINNRWKLVKSSETLEIAIDPHKSFTNPRYKIFTFLLLVELHRGNSI